MESKAFSKSVENKIPPMEFSSVKVKYITNKSNRFTNIFTYISSLIIIDNTDQVFCIFKASTLEAILASMSMSEISLQFLIILSFLSFFSIKIITACHCDVDS